MSLIRKPHELKTSACIKMLIYGQPGLGKSTLALSAPDPLLIDFDRGTHRVQAKHLKDTVQVERWEDIIQLLEKEDLRPFKTLIIDTAGKMLDYMSAFIIAGDPKMGRKDGQLALQGFGARKGMFQRFLAQAGMLGKHLVFVAHEKEEKDGDQKIIRPEIGGSSAGDLIKDLDLVGYMEAKGRVRTISFDPCEKFYGKNT
ncbi:MAG TPA: ATP-binding protein, partial [Fibrobacteria bacterium]|nr:ATP-binding protein [Fibrobacteria bacterium]